MSTPPTLTPLQRAFLALESTRAKLEALERARHEPIAVVGIGCRTPGGGDNPDTLWALLRAARDAVGPVPPDRWDGERTYSPDPDTPGKIVTREGGFLREVDGFDAALFGISPREVQGMDPQQRLVLEVAWEALEHAAIAPDGLQGSRTGVYIGIASNDYLHLMLQSGDPRLVDAHFMSGIAHSVASGRLSYLLGLQGPSMAIDTACSSSLVSVHLACQALRTGDCDTALAGGVNTMLSPDISVAYSRSRLLSPGGRCRTFDASADGIARGEGCGMIVLRRLSDAVASGDRIVGLIRGTAVNQDGPSSGLTAPNGPAQEAVIRAALVNAGVTPANIGYIEAHGTGTPLGDPLEMQALGAVFGAPTQRERPLWVGSVKTNFGHLEAAAGVVGLIKVLLSLAHREIAPHLHFQTPSPHIPWDELPVSIPTQPTPWPELGGTRLAGVSAFGFSGTNAHVVVEQAPPAPTPANAEVRRPLHVLTLSAQDGAALAAQAAGLSAALADHEDPELGDFAYTLNTGRARLPERAAFTASTIAEARERLDAIAQGTEALGVGRARVAAGTEPRVGLLFTGQGAQYPGMGRALYENAPAFRDALRECAALLDPMLPAPLLEVMYAGDDDETLHQTGFAQPALFALEYALTALWRSWGIVPAAVLGHSVGEVTAACVAGVLPLADAARLIAARGRHMQALPAGGGMRAVFAPLAAVEALLHETGEALDIAAVNSPAHTVVSGAIPALDRLATALDRAGIPHKPLRVSHAFHSSLMEAARTPFERELAALRFEAPRLRLVSNVTGESADPDAVRTPDYWSEHIRRPVQFARGMATLAALRCDALLEVGPTPTLVALGQECIGADAAVWCGSLRRGRDDWEQILASVRTLYLLGAPIDWAAFDRDYGRQKRALPTYPFQRTRIWFRAHRAAAKQREADDSAHPLLGRRLASPLPQAQFEAWLAADSPAFIGDHRAGGVVLLPGMASVEMGLAAARTLFGDGPPAVEQLVLREAMIFDGDAPRRVQTVVEVRQGDTALFRVQSTAEDEERWTLHAEGRIHVAAGGAGGTGEPLEAVRARCDRAMDAGALYAQQRRQGYEFGPRLHGVRAVWMGQGEALGQIELPAGEDAAPYCIHPALLDACVQVLGAALPGSGDVDSPGEDRGAPDASLYLPVVVRRFVIWRSPGPSNYSHVRLEQGNRPGAAAYTADIRVYDAAGALVAELEGLQLQRVSRDALTRLAGQRGRENLYGVRWVPQPLERWSAAGAARDAAGIARHASARLDSLSREHGLAAVDGYLPRLEALAGRWAERVLADLGWQPGGQEWESAESIAARLGVVPAHRRLLARLLAIYGEDGGAVERDGLWRAQRAPGRPEVERELDALRRTHPDAAELELLAGTGPGLVAAMRGECDPLQLLFPGGRTDVTERLYTDSPLARLYNTMVADAFEAILAAAPPGRPLRVVEVGGGTGGTTSHTAPRVGGRSVDYLFTDLGDSFVMRARRKFAGHPFLRYQVLDIERDPVEQGIADGSADVVIAANVLHATTDIRRTVRHVRRMLAPGGTLLLLEITAPQRWFDLTVGLTEGWWKFADADLRPAYTTLQADQWRAVLEEAGFDCAMAVPANTASWSLGRQQVVVARLPAGAETALERPSWVVLADAGGTGAELVEALRARGDRCLTLETGKGVGSGAVEVSGAAGLDAYRAALRTCSERLGSAFGIVDLRWLDAPDWGDPVTVEEALQPFVTGSLALAQAVLHECADVPSRLWLVTRGARAAGAVGAPLAPFQAAAWGFGLTLSLEHPELRPVRVDLDTGVDPEEPGMLLAELAADGREGQVAFRGGERLVARLARREPPIAAVRPQVAGPNYRLVAAEPGTLDRLELTACERPAPGSGEVELEVSATGLNFRDVLNVLGMYPGDPGPPGAECAGRVTRVGPDTEGLEVGDSVVATAPACFSRFVVARQEFVRRLPLGLTPAEGASIPTAYVTAAYALLTVGRLRAGERVLIHAAAGGVGLAAVQLARRAGAEVFATAGSPRKRAYLHRLGVRHIFSSRQAKFADEILALTEGSGVDVVLNSLSGDLLDESFRAIARGGRFLEIGKRGIWSPEQVAALGRDIAYEVLDVGAAAEAELATIGGVFAGVMDDIGSGALPPLPVTTFPLADAADAFRHMAQARHIGKIVVVHEPAGRPAPVRADGTYLISGGLAGLGLHVARRLVERGARHLVLISRRGVTADAEPVLAELRAAGATVHAAAADISDERAVADVLGRLRNDGPPLRGIVHAAGILDDGAMLAQEWPRFARVLAPKVIGARLLERLTHGDPLDWFVVFSSAASLVGSPGQANHAAANAVLDTLAHERRRLGRSGQSINWGPWSRVGAAAGEVMQARLGTAGVRALTPDEGLALLEELIAGGDVQAGAMAADWAQMNQQRAAAQLTSFLADVLPSAAAVEAPPVAQGAGTLSLRARLAANPPGRHRAVVAAFVRDAARRILGLPETATLDDRMPLGELGLDSLLAVELRNALGKETGTGLPATLLFDFPTVEALAEYLVAIVAGAGPATGSSAPRAGTGDDVDDVLQAIEAMTDEQADHLSAREPLP